MLSSSENKVVSILKRIIERIEAAEKINVLLEHYSTVNLRLNKEANQRISDWVDTIIDKKNPETEYRQLAKYIIYKDNIRKQSKQTQLQIYNIDFEFEGEFRNLYIFVGRSSKAGAVFHEIIDNNESITTNLYILPQDIEELKTALEDNNPNVLQNRVQKLLMDMRSTMVHELTHNLQIQNKEILDDEVNFQMRLKKYSVLKEIRRCFEKTQAHEAFALLDQANKLYKEKGNFIINTGRNTKKKEYLNCLLYLLLSCIGMKEEAIEILSKNIDLRDVLIALKNSNQVITRFTILWIIFCFAPRFSKFKWLIFKNGNPRTDYEINPSLLDANKDNLYNLLSKLSHRELKQLDKFIHENGEFHIISDLFSILNDNSYIVDWLAHQVTP